MPTGPRSEAKFAMASVPPAAGMRNPKFKSRYQTCRGTAVVAEAEDLHVVDLAERHIDGQLAGEPLLRLGERLGKFIKRMHIAHQRALAWPMSATSAFIGYRLDAAVSG